MHATSSEPHIRRQRRSPVALGIFPNTAKVRAQLAELSHAGEAEITEKDEMGRLYNELLEQLQKAEEEKEELQASR